MRKTNNVPNLDYAPVEQLCGHSQYNSDIYALGIIAIAAVLGLKEKEILQLQQHRSVLTGEIIWRSENLNIRREIEKVFDQMVRFDHHKRYQSAIEVLKEIKQVKTQRFIQQKQHKLWLTPAVISLIGTVTAVVLKSPIITINPP